MALCLQRRAALSVEAAFGVLPLFAGPRVAALGVADFGAVFEAVWRDERNIADAAVLAQLLSEQGLSAQRLQQAGSVEVTQRYAANTQQAIDKSVFGAPTYVVDGDMFWGQDRLDFVERKLAAR